ncbi:unnamed protein product, partial [Closterium sp. Yama58-4]
NLAGNLLHGPFPSELALSPSLASLNVANNSLTGRLSEDLCNLNLTCVNVMGNPLRGPIPSCWRNFTCLDFANTSLLVVPNETCRDVPYHSCNPPLAVAVAPPSAAASSVNVVAIICGVVGGAALIALLIAGAMVVMKHIERKRREEEERRLEQDLETQISSRHFGTLRRFTSEELKKATNGFDEDYVLGEGGFSKVYKGKLEDGKFVAIKRIKDEKRAGGELQFLSEVEMISRAVHRNLIRAEGFCVERGECMLVLPFCSNGSVASRTQGKEGNPMDWPTRMKVARGAAEGIGYLHTDCKPKLVHRDIKAANVLLDENDEAVIADFGLAKEMDVNETHATTAVKGTIGHIAPEYFVSGQCSEKTDVYAFGVFLLELVSGKDVYGLTVVPEAEEILLRDWLVSGKDVYGLTVVPEAEEILLRDWVSRLLVKGKADVLVKKMDMAQWTWGRSRRCCRWRCCASLLSLSPCSHPPGVSAAGGGQGGRACRPRGEEARGRSGHGAGWPCCASTNSLPSMISPSPVPQVSRLLVEGKADVLVGPEVKKSEGAVDMGQVEKMLQVALLCLLLLPPIYSLPLCALHPLSLGASCLQVSRLLVEGKADVLVDPEVKKPEGAVDMGQVEKMLQVALLCLKNDPAERPTMEDVAKMVAGSELTEKWQQWQVRVLCERVYVACCVNSLLSAKIGKNDPAERPTMEDVAKMVAGSELTEKWQQWQVRGVG